MDHKEFLKRMWFETKDSHPFISFLWVLRHPLLSMRFIRFAFKVMVYFGIGSDIFGR